MKKVKMNILIELYRQSHQKCERLLFCNIFPMFFLFVLHISIYKKIMYSFI